MGKDSITRFYMFYVCLHVSDKLPHCCITYQRDHCRNCFFLICSRSSHAIPIAILTASIIILSLFPVSQFLFQQNSNRLNTAASSKVLVPEPLVIQQIDSPPKTQPPIITNLSNTTHNTSQIPTPVHFSSSTIGSSPQGSLIQDAASLNNRTLIWSGVFRAIHNNPMLLLFGCSNTTETISILGAKHSHNAWLEVLLRLGIPGFLLSLCFTVFSIYTALSLLFSRKSSLWIRIISMLVLALLVSGFLEPALFFTKADWHSHDFAFFLCLGYLMENRSLRSN